MPLPVIPLDSDFTVFADVASADTYLDGAAHADSWRAIDDDDTKGRYLVTATRILNRQLWRGAKTVADQALAWPRINTGIDPAPIVDANGIPLDVVNASIELALALADGSDVQNQQTGVERVRSMSAGGVSITNFRGIDTPTRFPQIVQELLRIYIGGDGAFVPKATGVDKQTIFPIDLGFNTGGI